MNHRQRQAFFDLTIEETLAPKQYEHEWNKHFVPQSHLCNRHMLSRGPSRGKYKWKSG